jgi:hypothetical protein
LFFFLPSAFFAFLPSAFFAFLPSAFFAFLPFALFFFLGLFDFELAGLLPLPDDSFLSAFSLAALPAGPLATGPGAAAGPGAATGNGSLFHLASASTRDTSEGKGNVF